MCYPYGGYNKNTLEILKKNKCTFALIEKPGYVEFQLIMFTY